MSFLNQRLSTFRHCLFRVKSSAANKVDDGSNLARCLTTFDLTSLGIGSILGAGIYVVSGQVAMTIAGPSILLSFTIAAFASLLSGLCYAEFGSRVPRTTGSAYAYSYHTVGEFIAFVIGWNLILEYMIGTAADARALSSAVDYLMGHRLKNFSLSTFGVMPGLNTYPDPLAFLLTIAVTVILALGVKESARYTTIFNVLNGLIALAVIIVGSTKADFRNWGTTEKFFPKSAHGVFAGAAACFYAFVGFDIIATTGEEARDASRSIPTAVALSLVVCYVLYMGVSGVLTLMVPFNSLHSSSPLTEAFDHVGIHWAKWVIGSGAVCGLSASLLGSEFPLPRIIYAMATDGLLFKFLRRVSSRTETPVLATILPGILTAFFAMLFDLSELVEMMSIGTLLAYSLVCTSILLLRYRPDQRYHILSQHTEAQITCTEVNHIENSDTDEELWSVEESIERPLLSSTNEYQPKSESNSGWNLKFCCKSGRQFSWGRPTKSSSNLVLKLTVVVWILSIALSIILMLAENEVEGPNSGHLSALKKYSFLSIACLIALVIMSCSVVVSWQPQDLDTLSKLHFKVPLVPYLPMLTIVINVFLMVRLSTITWIRFVVWMIIGLIIYFGYGIRHSEESLSFFRYEADGMEMPGMRDEESSSLNGERIHLTSDASSNLTKNHTSTTSNQDTANNESSKFQSVPLNDS